MYSSSSILRAAALLAFAVAVSVHAQQTPAPRTLTVIAHDSFAYSESVIEAFTAETAIQIEVLRLGDGGALVNQAILTQGNPLGDVLYGVDNTFLSRALDADLFQPYESPALEDVPDDFILDPDYRVTPIDYSDVCLNYDSAYFADRDLAVPQTLARLTDTAYRGLLVTPNPATSSPGLAFLLNSVAVFGDAESEAGDADGYDYLDFWRDLVANDVQISSDWTNAYYGEFSGSAGSAGTRPLVVSYASSPPAEIYFMEAVPERAPTGAVVAPETCFRQIEFAGILAGAREPEAAQQFIDFLLSRAFQEDMPLTMFVFPVLTEAALPDVFVQYAAPAQDPIRMDANTIDQDRERWIEAWTRVVLR